MTIRMRIRHIGLIGLISLICLTASAQAQEVDSTAVTTLPLLEELAPEVEVHQSESVSRLLLSRAMGIERNYETVRNGYRIQVYSSNDQRNAGRESADIAEKLRGMDLGLEVYRTYNAPFWRVRLGNYRTQADANEVLEELTHVIEKQMPELLEKGSIYIVHDEEVVLMQ